jgi:hypothetical protein
VPKNGKVLPIKRREPCPLRSVVPRMGYNFEVRRFARKEA